MSRLTIGWHGRILRQAAPTTARDLYVGPTSMTSSMDRGKGPQQSRANSRQVAAPGRVFCSRTRFTEPPTCCSARPTSFPSAGTSCPHVEQARVVARRFDARYAAGVEVFPEPTALINDQQLILSVDGQKMSKSRGSVIRLAATEGETATLIRKARTDSEPTITYEPERRPEVANLLTIASGFTPDHRRHWPKTSAAGVAARSRPS